MRRFSLITVIAAAMLGGCSLPSWIPGSSRKSSHSVPTAAPVPAKRVYRPHAPAAAPVTCSYVPSSAGNTSRLTATRRIISELRPLHKTLPKPEPGDWRHDYPEERQSITQYEGDRKRVTVTGTRNVLYLAPLGTHEPKHQKDMEIYREFLAVFFGIRVADLDNIPVDKLSAHAYRGTGFLDERQLDCEFVLDILLRPHRPKDAAAVLGVTAMDLWPGDHWGAHYAFGMAWVYSRVAVISTSRLGNQFENETDSKGYLLRMLKVSAHELGHVFSIAHCQDYRCCMNGCNSVIENDRAPLWYCPVCLAKLCLATGADPVTRYRRLAEFCRDNGFRKECLFYRKSAEKLSFR